MANDISTATAAPEAFWLDDNESITLYPLRLHEWGNFENWMREAYLSPTVNAIAKSDMPLERQDKLIARAQERAMDMTAILAFQQMAANKRMSGSDNDENSQRSEAVGVLQSFGGMLRIVHLALRDYQGNYKYDLNQVSEMFSGRFQKLTEAYGSILSLSFPSEFGSSKKKTEKKGPTPNESQ